MTDFPPAYASKKIDGSRSFLESMKSIYIYLCLLGRALNTGLFEGVEKGIGNYIRAGIWSG